MPEESEDLLIIQALQHVNCSRFNSDELQLFEGILNDVFSDIEVLNFHESDLQNSIEQCMTEDNLQIVTSQVHKTSQLHEVMRDHLEVIIYGKTASGKTTVLKSLINVYKNSQSFKKVKLHVLNPTSLTFDQLFGSYDQNYEWIDGLLAKILRESTGKSDWETWILFDGALEASWLENLNSLLDENKTLCLANNEKIKVTEEVHVIFEVNDLNLASPMTISRCGMVYIDENDLGWRQIVESWMFNMKIPEELKNYTNSLFDQYIDEFLKHTDDYNEIIRQPELSKIKMQCSLLSYFLKDISFSSSKNEESQTYICKLWIWTLLWSIGSNFSEESRVFLENQMRKLFQQNEKANLPLDGSLWE